MEPAEISELARQLAREREKMVRSYRKLHEVGIEEAERQVQEMMNEPVEELSEILRERDPAIISWGQLDRVAVQEPERAMEIWDGIKQAAADELETGNRAAKALRNFDMTPWDRARFLVIRKAMINEWQPRGGLEMSLIDILAQLQTCHFQWLEEFMIVSTTEIQKQKRDLEDRWERRPTKPEVVNEEEKAAAMMDRFNRMYMRTLRGLRDLRRYAGQITIESASQVNIGEKQINVATQEKPTSGNRKQPHENGKT